MKWTNTNPSAAGWYWLRGRLTQPMIVHVAVDDGALVAEAIGLAEQVVCLDRRGSGKTLDRAEWSGPLAEPSAWGWYWLSFCEPSRPSGAKFLGASVVGPAADMLHAVLIAHAMGCNPGGEVEGAPIPASAEARIPPAYRRRVLTREECQELDDLLGAKEAVS